MIVKFDVRTPMRSPLIIFVEHPTTTLLTLMLR